MTPGRALELQRRAMAIADAFRPAVSRRATRDRPAAAGEAPRGRNRNVSEKQIDRPPQSAVSVDSAARCLAVIMGQSPRRALKNA